MIRSSNENNLTQPKGVDITFSLFIMNKMELYLENSSWILLSPITRDVEAEAVEAVLFLWKRKREKSTASASTQEGRMEREKKLVLLSFVEEQIGGA